MEHILVGRSNNLEQSRSLHHFLKKEQLLKNVWKNDCGDVIFLNLQKDKKELVLNRFRFEEQLWDDFTIQDFIRGVNEGRKQDSWNPMRKDKVIRIWSSFDLKDIEWKRLWFVNLVKFTGNSYLVHMDSNTHITTYLQYFGTEKFQELDDEPTGWFREPYIIFKRNYRRGDFYCCRCASGSPRT